MILMKKYFKWVFILFPCIIRYYFLMLFYSINKNKHSRVLIYKKVNKLINKVSKVINIEYRVEGLDNIPLDDSYLITPNHISMFDPLIFLSLLKDPVSFVCKNSVEKIPLVNRIIYLLDGFFLERDNLRQEIKVMKQVKNNMEDKILPYCIFPEGTRTKDPKFKMNPFKAGTFKYPMSIKKKIVPVFIYGTYDILSKNINKKSYPVFVSFLEPITYDDYKDLNTQQVSELVQKRIQEKFDQFINGK